ncbi:Immediate early response like-protein [Trichinella spiralis]|uniref:Immediate early response like-protein n=1 Tax=Trichinella spiralis TaxID=6334 RepID=A0ABR3KVK9_TRISP
MWMKICWLATAFVWPEPLRRCCLHHAGQSLIGPPRLARAPPTRDTRPSSCFISFICVCFLLDCGRCSMTTMANDENEMCEKLIELSFAKIVSSKSGRGGTSLRKNLLIVQVLHRAKMEQRRRQFLQTSSYAAAAYSSDLADLQDSQGSRPTVVPDGYCDSRFSQQQPLAEEMFYASPPYEDYTWSCGETHSAGIECVNSISSSSSSSNDILFSQDQISCNNNNSNKTLKRKTEFNDDNTSQDEISCDCWVLPKRACVGHSLDGGAPVEVASSDEMLAIGNENPDSNFDEFFSFFTPSLPAQVDNSAGHSTDHSLPCPSLLELICES